MLLVFKFNPQLGHCSLALAADSQLGQRGGLILSLQVNYCVTVLKALCIAGAG